MGTHADNVPICLILATTILREIFASISFCESPINKAEKKFVIFNFATSSRSLTTPPCQGTEHVFQRRNDSKRLYNTLIKASGSLSTKDCGPKACELNPRSYSQLRRRQAS